MSTPNVQSTSSPVRKKRILLLDDEHDIRESMKSALKAHYWVDSKGDALEALRAFKPHFYDLIILDYRMPNIDGAEVYREIKKIDPKQKVCFITAYEGLDKRISSLQWRDRLFQEDVVFPLLKKPFDTATLLAKIASIIGE